MRPMELVIDESGNISTLGDLPEGIADIGTVTTCRASWILPTNPAKRVAFRALRRLFGDNGGVAAWTRSWRGPWEAILACGSAKERFTAHSREECLAWEEARVKEQMVNAESALV